MNKFTKGRTYLASGNGLAYKYIIHQTGLKSWRATVFSHVCPVESVAVIEGNSMTLYEKLKNRLGDIIDIRGYHTDSTLRQAMFNILKTGKFDE